jgi:predicted AAA+ superfamily ATPase
LSNDLRENYAPRVVDGELAVRLSAVGGVVIEGPKACGKTATARQVAASEVLLDVDQAARDAVAIDPRLVLDGPVPRLIDEWQTEPAIWNHVRRAIDDRAAPGQFLLTGSAVPADDITRHTGAGRIGRLRMRPMSLLESGSSSGRMSLAALLAGKGGRSPDASLTISDLAERIAVGGWPGIQRLPSDAALRANRDYLDEVARVDVNRVDGGRRDPEKVGRLLRSLARNVATHASLSTLAHDTAGSSEAVHRVTATDHLDALTRLMVVEDQPAWAPHLRSKAVMRRGPKRHFVDPSLAVAALRATPADLLVDFELLGFLFESLVVRDLRVYAQAAEADVLQYRDSNGLEVDAIVRRPGGPWAAFEVKLGGSRIDEAARTLLRFADQIDISKVGEPAALGVIVSGGYGYVREDGVVVIPIGALGP